MLKSTPFGFKTCGEYFDLLITPKFSNLRFCTKIEEYYDFILASGVLRDWIKSEFNYDKMQMETKFYNNSYFSLFYSIYNNLKHFTYNEDPSRILQYIIADGTPGISTFDNNGNALWNDCDTWNDDEIWVDNVIGEQGFFNYVVIAKNTQTNTDQAYWLYEVCKQAYLYYKAVFEANT